MGQTVLQTVAQKPNPRDKLAECVNHHILQVVTKARYARSPVQKTVTDIMMVSIDVE